jgi:Ca-activated chloride channel family protein
MNRYTASLTAALSAALLLLGSCSRIPGQLLIMEGNFHHSQGRYAEAVEAYLRALDHEEVVSYAEYGLGSAYLSLDEGKAALERFDASAEALKQLPAGGHQELSYRIHYNTGVVRFGEGNFEGAAEAFRQALEIDGGRIEAKRNLELSLLSLSRDASSAASAGAEGDEIQETDVRAAALFDYLQRKEQSQWKSREWTEEAPAAGPDY